MSMLRYKIFSESKTISHEKPVIVMLHGLGGGYANFYSCIHALKPHYDLLLIELPSHGRSPMKMSQMSATWEELCGRVMDVVDSLGIQKAIFAGGSLGSMLVKYIVLNYSERVEKYILVGPIGNFNLLIRTSIRVVRLLLPFLPLETVLKLILAVVIPDEVSRYGREVFLATSKRLTNKEFAAWCKLLSRFKNVQRTYERTMGEEANGLYLVGELDRFFRLMLKKDEKRVKNMVFVKNAGHICTTDQPEATNRQLLAFLQTGRPVEDEGAILCQA